MKLDIQIGKSRPRGTPLCQQAPTTPTPRKRLKAHIIINTLSGSIHAPSQFTQWNKSRAMLTYVSIGLHTLANWDDQQLADHSRSIRSSFPSQKRRRSSASSA